MKSALAASVFVVLGAALSGCAHPQAKTIAEMPPLDVPAPPPRNVEPVGTEPPRPIGLVAAPAPPPAATAPTPVRPPGPPRADAPPADASKPADDVGRTTPAAPPATLQTVPAQQESELEAKIRTTLSRATADLSRVDYGRLNANARSQYESAKRFVTQADDALRDRNLVYAGTLADKAGELAAQLAGR
jgi:hypothetical protein